MTPPRSERPPIPRTVSLCEKIEDATVITSYELSVTVAIIVVSFLFNRSVRDAGITRSYIDIYYRRSNNTPAVNCDEGKCRFVLHSFCVKYGSIQIAGGRI